MERWESYVRGGRSGPTDHVAVDTHVTGALVDHNADRAAAPLIEGPHALMTQEAADESRDPASADEQRFLHSTNEAGTPPGDRKFRPDVEGLRAVAVLLVVLFHAGVPHMGGGFVGVDVFFVISGFVITGLLLRERSSTGKTSLPSFYGRRCRRILPAATVVIIATVLASYHWLGYLRGDQTAVDGRTASLFFANIHFASIGTNYLGAQQPPSPLQNFWSLSVEEQFYLVYPTLFLSLAAIGRRLTLRVKLTIALAAIVVASFIWSIVQTSSNATGAYFSPFTRAWELALGGLVAVAAPYIARTPRMIAAAISWCGLGAIVMATLIFGAATPYPGAAVALPVLGSAAVIAAGTAAPLWGVEWLLGRRPMQWLGKLSYSLYLWHWPILMIVAQHLGRTPSVGVNLLWVLVALGISVASYAVIENPIRHAKVLQRNRVNSLILGAVLIGISVTLLSVEIHAHP